MSGALRTWLFAAVVALAAALPGPARAGAYEDFFQAVASDDATAVQRLLSRGMDPNSVDPQGHPALIAALREKSWKVSAVLLARPTIDLERPNRQDETALMIAAHQGHQPTVEALLRRGAQPNRPGWTPLHYASSAGQDAIARVLLENNAYIDAESPNGTTPLMMASRHGHLALARMLVEEGADPRPRNQAGLSAADYFERVGDRTAADWLRQQARGFGSVPTGRAASADTAATAGSPGAAARDRRRGAASLGALERSGRRTQHRATGLRGREPFVLGRRAGAGGRSPARRRFRWPAGHADWTFRTVRAVRPGRRRCAGNRQPRPGGRRFGPRLRRTSDERACDAPTGAARGTGFLMPCRRATA